MKCKKIQWITYLTIIILLLFDMWSKNIALKYLMNKDSLPIIKNILELSLVKNKGIAFGLFYGKLYVISIITIIVCIILFISIHKIPNNTRYLALSINIGCIIAGALGNILDRIFRGYVVDFIYFKVIDYPVFNVADIYICVGAVVFVCMYLFVYEEDELSFLDFMKKKK